MDSDPIPLYDGPPSGYLIHHTAQAAADDATSSGGRQAVRSRRRGARRECERTRVCLTVTEGDGRVDHAECPVVNISRSGMALHYDRRIVRGARVTIQYRTVSLSPVHVTAAVRHCVPAGPDRYQIGLSLDRPLAGEELRPARDLPGRDVAPGIRGRRFATNRGDAPAEGGPVTESRVVEDEPPPG